MNNKEFCEKLNISEPTLYNWKKEKAFLYEIVMRFKKENIDNVKNLSKSDELLKYFNNLSEVEKEYYIADIKARILKKEID